MSAWLGCRARASGCCRGGLFFHEMTVSTRALWVRLATHRGNTSGLAPSADGLMKKGPSREEFCRKSVFRLDQQHQLSLALPPPALSANVTVDLLASSHMRRFLRLPQALSVDTRLRFPGELGLLK